MRGDDVQQQAMFTDSLSGGLLAAGVGHHFR